LSWNIDIILMTKVETLQLPDYVPDMLMGQVDLIGFEDATSAMRFDPPELCVTRLDMWGVVIDVPAKLRGFQSYLTEHSRGRNLYVIHIGNNPMLLMYSDGAERQACHGLVACRAQLLTMPHACADLDDGELVAWSLADQLVGQPTIDALWRRKFAVFSLAPA
jgi:hypothetical protein